MNRNANFVQAVFNAFILQLGIVGIFDEAITLKSGRKSHWYVNWRDALADAWAVHLLLGYIHSFVRGLGYGPTCYYGVPEGATKLGVLMSYQAALMVEDLGGGAVPIPMGRAKPKDHGHPKDRFFVGAPRGKIIVLEDVTTTGGSLLTTIGALRELEDVEILCAIGLTNRMEKRDDGLSVQEAVREAGVDYHHMSSALDLLPEVIESVQPSKEVVDFIVKEFEAVGLKPLELRRE